MADKASIKKKEIQIQKPAQSLTAFQHKLSSGIDKRAQLMRRLIVSGAVAALLVAVAAVGLVWRNHKIEKHETALSALITEVNGNLLNPVPLEQKEQRLRAALPKLEKLAGKAPGPCKDVANGLVAAWKLEVEGKGGELPTPKDAWSRLRLAQRSIALGQAKDAAQLLSPLHGDAKPGRAWSQLYWQALLQVRMLEGDREQALKDYSEYRKRFKSQADLTTLEKTLDSI